MQKFENVDILKSLKAIMQTHTQHFQSDFDIDRETLKQLFILKRFNNF